MRHRWEKLEDPAAALRGTFLEEAKSDVWFCRQCGQITMSEPGHPADDTLFGLVEDCGTQVVKQVLET